VWTTCITCRQPYSGQFDADLAEVHWNMYRNKDPTQVQSFHNLRGALKHMGDALLDQLRLDEALKFCQRLYNLLKGQIVDNADGSSIIHWIEPVQIAQTCNTLGGCFLRLGKLDQAMSVFCDGLNYTVGRKEGAVLDSEIPGCEAVLLNNLAEVYVKRGEMSKAVPLRRQSYALREKVHGKNSYEYVNAAFSLGCVLLHDKNRAEGLDLIVESREIALRILGPLHPHVMKCDLLLEQLGAAVDCEVNPSPVGLGRCKPNWARIRGLKSRADLNRELVEVSSYLQDQGRYKTILRKDDGEEEILSIKPTNLILEAGVKVIIRGLLSAKDLNGKKGEVITFHRDISRYSVKLCDGSSKEIGVKPENAIAY